MSTSTATFDSARQGGATIPSQGQIQFQGSIPVQTELPIRTEVPLEGTFPTRASVLVEGELAMRGSIPLRTTIPVNTSIPIDGGVLCRGEADFKGVVPLSGTIPINANLPLSANLPLGPSMPQAPREVVTVQRIVRPAPQREVPKPRELPKEQPRAAPPPPAPRAPVLPAPLPAYIDPRPNVPHERGEKAHDFEYHREGRYAARRNSLTRETGYAPAGPNRYGGAPLAAGPIVNPTVAPIVASDYDRAFTHAPNAPGGIDPRPPLSVEKERVYDYEVHREGGYAKGHTFAGARPAVGIRNVLAGPAGGSYTNGQSLA